MSKKDKTKPLSPVLFTDVIGDTMVISDELFKDRRRPRPTRNKYAVFKGGREQYLPMLVDTIKNPAEIWLVQIKKKDGGIRTCKRYISIYIDKEGIEICGFAVFDMINGIWRGTTTFQTDIEYIEKQRRGTLLFRK